MQMLCTGCGKVINNPNFLATIIWSMIDLNMSAHGVEMSTTPWTTMRVNIMQIVLSHCLVWLMSSGRTTILEHMRQAYNFSHRVGEKYMILILRNNYSSITLPCMTTHRQFQNLHNNYTLSVLGLCPRNSLRQRAKIYRIFLVLFLNEYSMC